MKNFLQYNSITKVFISLLISTSFTSCMPQEEFVTFYIENEINEEFLLLNNDVNSDEIEIQSHTTLDLRTSEAWNTYVEGLNDIDIRTFEILLEHTTGNLENGAVYIEDIHLGDFTKQMSYFSIEDPQTKQQIEELFLERSEVNFYARGSCQNEYLLLVKVRIKVNGTFVR